MTTVEIIRDMIIDTLVDSNSVGIHSNYYIFKRIKEHIQYEKLK